MPLTPEQFNLLATKDDLKNLEKGIREDMATKDVVNEILISLLATKDNLRELEERIDGMATKDDINKILNILDNIAKGIDTTKTEQAGIKMNYNNLEERVGDNENKIKLLQEQVGV